jgi:hypothetical protein
MHAEVASVRNCLAVATLTIRRTGYFGVARKLKILIDGQVVGAVGREGGSIDLEPGPHEVAVKMDWVKSRPLELSVEEDETVRLEARSSLLGMGFDLVRVAE